MKMILALLVLMVTFLPNVVLADFWVVDLNNQIVAKCSYQPDTKDLESRDEIAIWSDKDIEFSEAEYRGGKIVKHIKTQDEIKTEEKAIKKAKRDGLIRDRIHKIARDQLVAEGIINE